MWPCVQPFTSLGISHLEKVPEFLEGIQFTMPVQLLSAAQYLCTWFLLKTKFPMVHVKYLDKHHVLPKSNSIWLTSTPKIWRYSPLPLCRKMLEAQELRYGQLLAFQKNPNATTEAMRSRIGHITAPRWQGLDSWPANREFGCFHAPRMSTSDSSFLTSL